MSENTRLSGPEGNWLLNLEPWQYEAVEAEIRLRATGEYWGSDPTRRVDVYVTAPELTFRAALLPEAADMTAEELGQALEFASARGLLKASWAGDQIAEDLRQSRWVNGVRPPVPPVVERPLPRTGRTVNEVKLEIVEAVRAIGELSSRPSVTPAAAGDPSGPVALQITVVGLDRVRIDPAWWAGVSLGEAERTINAAIARYAEDRSSSEAALVQRLSEYDEAQRRLDVLRDELETLQALGLG